MIDPKLSTYLNRALYLIIGPHQGSTSPTQLIKQGEQLLNNLKSLGQYSCLLSNFLVQKTHYFKSYTNSINTTNYKLFVILQLIKQIPITNQSVWWHIVQFYYTCNEKLQKLIIQLIIKHIQYAGILNNCYRPFLTQVTSGIKWGIVPLGKIITLIDHLINKFNQFLYWEDCSKLWKMSHLQFISDSLCHVLKYSSLEFINYNETIVIQLAKINMSAYLQVKSQQQHNQWCSFVLRWLKNMMAIVSTNNFNVTSLIKLILYLNWRSSGQLTQYPFNFVQIVHEIPQIVYMVVKGGVKKCQNYQSALGILNFFFIKFQNNRSLLNSQALPILQHYYNYIIQVQSLSSTFEIMSEIPNSQKNDQDLQTPINSNYIFDFSKYTLLAQCISQTEHTLRQALLKKSQMKIIAYYAYADHCQATQQIVSIVVSYLNSIIYYSSSDANISIVKCCLRFFYRFVVGDPNFNLIQVCTTVINLRTVFPHLQDLCDILLCKATPIIITCTQLDILWDFAKDWIHNLQQNYMDVRAFSFYPLMLIIQTAQSYHFIQSLTAQRQDYIDFLLFFQSLMEIIDQQQKSTKSKYSNINQKKFCWASNTEIFYKMCSIFAKYLTDTGKFIAEQQNIKILQNIDKIIQMILRHVFRNQLYSRDTAFIYVYSLIIKNNSQQIKELITNMMTDEFWSNSDDNELLFYSCALVGLTATYKNIYNSHEIYARFINILENVKNKQEFSGQYIQKLKTQIGQFISVFDMKVPNFRQQFQASCQCH